MFKNCSPEMLKEKERQLEEVKQEMEEIKAAKIAKLKLDQEEKKSQIQKEK